MGEDAIFLLQFDFENYIIKEVSLKLKGGEEK